MRTTCRLFSGELRMHHCGRKTQHDIFKFGHLLFNPTIDFLFTEMCPRLFLLLLILTLLTITVTPTHFFFFPPVCTPISLPASSHPICPVHSSWHWQKDLSRLPLDAEEGAGVGGQGRCISRISASAVFSLQQTQMQHLEQCVSMPVFQSQSTRHKMPLTGYFFCLFLHTSLEISQ